VTVGVTYTPSGPAVAGATLTVAATPTQGHVLSGQTQWTHTFTSPDASQCSQSEPPTPTDSQTGSEQGPEQGIVGTPTQTDQSASESPTPAPTPTTQLPKTGNDHVTLLALIAAVLLSGGVAMSAGAARRRT
jgi:LPXTG-motif cell wall-anchored protein